IDHRKLSNLTCDHLEQSADVRGPDALVPDLTALARSGAAIALDSATAADALSRLIAGAGGKPVRGNDPVSLLKAVKNITEIEGAIFPDGTTGAQLDSFARQFLWQAGLDFEHGTGHGVGSYLSVHEGPARISKLGTTPLKRGMILSNEPGYYKTDAYGIRIENLELVIGTDVPGAEK